MKARQIIKMGFFLYVGWQISSGLDQALGRAFMDLLKEHKPEIYDKLSTKMKHIH